MSGSVAGDERDPGLVGGPLTRVPRSVRYPARPRVKVTMAPDGDGLAAGVFDRPGGLTCLVLLLLAVGERDVGSFAGECEGDRSADAGDEGPTAGQAAAAAVPLRGRAAV